MILMGIVGGSGTGKSTVTNFLKEKMPDCVTINLDDYMRKYWEEYKEEIISNLNLKIETEFWHAYLIKDIDTVKKWASIIEKDIEKSIRNVISENRDAKIIILDWAFLPLFPIYNECDITIFVKCDLDIKLNRLTKKLKKKGTLGRWNVQTLLDRLENTSLEEWGYLATYTISNNGTLDELENNVNYVKDIYFDNDLIFK